MGCSASVHFHRFSVTGKAKPEVRVSTVDVVAAAESPADCLSDCATLVSQEGGTSHSTPTITARQRTLILTSWRTKLGAMRVALGRQVFLEVFTKRPDLKNLFTFKSVATVALQDDEGLHHHAALFMDVLSDVVENIDTLETVVEQELLTLGGKHIHFSGFDLTYFPILRKAIIVVWRRALGRDVGHNTFRAWYRLFSFIVSKLEDGYSLQMVNSKEQLSIKDI